MENIVQQTNGIDDAVRAFLAMIVLLICIECVEYVKKPEFRCEKCDKVYKQEARYRQHMIGCVDNDTPIFRSELSVLLRQNHEIMVLLQKQQEMIEVLTARLLPVMKMNIE